MSNELEQIDVANKEELLTVYIAEQQFGISILQIQDVLRPQSVSPIPLSPREIGGSLNLRGRIVTAIDVRKRLGLPPSDSDSKMSIVVEHKNEFFSLLIDKVGDVLNLDKNDFDFVPTTLDPIWKEVALGIYRLDSNLLIVLDVAKLLNFQEKK